MAKSVTELLVNEIKFCIWLTNPKGWVVKYNYKLLVYYNSYR